MECRANIPVQTDEWELLYNHMQICEALVQEGAPVAKALFALREERLTSRKGGVLSDETAIILLTSLNRSLYDYLLFQWAYLSAIVVTIIASTPMLASGNVPVRCAGQARPF